MSDFLSSLGNFFGSSAGKGLGEIAGLGATGTGLVGNLLADQQRAAAAKQAQANMNLSPQALAAQVSSATQPLDRSLVQAVTGNVNANLAEQGLSQAPGLIATATSQALAPFQQQNQQTAMQLVLQRLGLPAEFARTIPANANLAPLLALLMKGGLPGAGGGTFPGPGGAGVPPGTMPFPINPSGPMPSGQPPGWPSWSAPWSGSSAPYDAGSPPQDPYGGGDTSSFPWPQSNP